MKRKRLKVVCKGTVLEGELPKALQRQGPKWLKRWPKVRLARVKPPACPQCGAAVRIASSGSEGGGAANYYWCDACDEPVDVE
jgi:hypothetical protein